MSALDKFSFLNTAHGMEFCGDMEDVYLDAMQEYVDGDNSTLLKEYADAKDYKNYRVQVHSLKSSSRMIGADELADKALALENAAKEENGEYIAQNNIPVVNEYQELMQKIREALA